MLQNIIYSLIGAIIGTTVGSVGTWFVSRRLAFLERLQDEVEAACKELEEYRISYCQFYAEYLSPTAKSKGRNWAQPVGDAPDRDYLELQRRLDVGRGNLRVHRAILHRMLHRDVAVKVDEAIQQILAASSWQSPAGHHIIEDLCMATEDAILLALPSK